MFKTLIAVALGALTLAIVGCAQVGGGLNQPTIKSQVGGKNVVPLSSALLYLSSCGNAQAVVDYNTAVEFCEGKLPSLPLSFTTEYGTALVTNWCTVYEYTNPGTNQLITGLPQTATLNVSPASGCPGVPAAAPSSTAAKS